MFLLLRGSALLSLLLLVVWTLIFPLATLLAVAFVIPLALLAGELAKGLQPRRVGHWKSAVRLRSR